MPLYIYIYIVKKERKYRDPPILTAKCEGSPQLQWNHVGIAALAVTLGLGLVIHLLPAVSGSTLSVTQVEQGNPCFGGCTMLGRRISTKSVLFGEQIAPMMKQPGHPEPKQPKETKQKLNKNKKTSPKQSNKDPYDLHAQLSEKCRNRLPFHGSSKGAVGRGASPRSSSREVKITFSVV